MVDHKSSFFSFKKKKKKFVVEEGEVRNACFDRGRQIFWLDFFWMTAALLDPNSPRAKDASRGCQFIFYGTKNIFRVTRVLKTSKPSQYRYCFGGVVVLYTRATCLLIGSPLQFAQNLFSG